MKMWFNFGLITFLGIIHAINGSFIVGGMCTISLIFIMALDSMKKDIIKAFKEANK